MASPNPSQTTSIASPCSTFSRIVVLHDWRLVMSEIECSGKRLAVCGSTSTRRARAFRIFTSAPIIRRIDAYALETADGITVLIQGIINQVETMKNGFPADACRDFLIGFPYTWNCWAEKVFGEDAIDESDVTESAESSPSQHFKVNKFCKV